ncbi:MAG: crossover junction endodeoxyribonuclease RuvC [Balneolaceae bacterium]
MPKRIILGIDPGSRHTGYAILVEEGRVFRAIACDAIHVDHLKDHTDRLQYLYRAVTDLIREYRPTDCAVETPVYGVDPLAMLKLGRAQAAALLAIANEELPVCEYYPKAIKKAVTGNGNAAKKQVAYMLEKLVTLPSNRMSADASDALAVAWCHQMALDRPVGTSSGKAYHQNNGKSSWAAFVDENPDRVSS